MKGSPRWMRLKRYCRPLAVKHTSLKIKHLRLFLPLSRSKRLFNTCNEAHHYESLAKGRPSSLLREHQAVVRDAVQAAEAKTSVMEAKT